MSRKLRVESGWRIADDVAVAAEGGEELAGGQVPGAIEPGAFLPAGEVFEDAAIFWVVEGVVIHPRRHEERRKKVMSK